MSLVCSAYLLGAVAENDIFFYSDKPYRLVKNITLDPQTIYMYVHVVEYFHPKCEGNVQPTFKHKDEKYVIRYQSTRTKIIDRGVVGILSSASEILLDLVNPQLTAKFDWMNLHPLIWILAWRDLSRDGESCGNNQSPIEAQPRMGGCLE